MRGVEEEGEYNQNTKYVVWNSQITNLKEKK